MKREVFIIHQHYSERSNKPSGFRFPFAFITFIVTCFLLSNSLSAQRTNELVKQGNEAYRKNDFPTAIKQYTKAVEADSKNAIARFNMANAEQKVNHYEDAANTYDDVISKTSDADLQSKAYYNKGLAMIQQKKTDEAIDAFKQSLRLAPMDNDARENLQKALSEKKVPPPPKQQPQPNAKKNQQQNSKMDRKMMEQKFKMLEDQEKQLQGTLQKQKDNTREQSQDW